MFFENLIYFILSAAILIISASYLIKSLLKISRFLKITEFTAAFIIMAIATSLPELFVGISSAFSGIPALSLGNVIGASIIDLTIVAGIIILIGKGIKTNGKIGKDVHYVLIAVTLIIILFLIGNSLSRIDGFILLAFFIFNSFRMLKKRKKYKKKLKRHKEIEELNISIAVFIFVLALLALFTSARYAVKYASLIAADLNIPSLIIGLFFLSFATTLPELIFGIRACELKHKELAVGDYTGAVLTNMTLVTGLVAIIHPIKTSTIPFLISIFFLFITVSIFLIFLKSDKELKIKEGILLILVYAAFTITELFINSRF